MSRWKDQRGQILVMFAGGLIAFIGLAALVIDLGTVYSLQRTERSLADAASLAGAQDLTTSSSDRTIPTGAYIRARQDALDAVAGAQGLASPSCNTASDTLNVLNCQVGLYSVDVKANPVPSFVNVDPYRAVQVTVRNPDVPLTFARLLGQHDWAVGITSVAGLGFSKSYAIVTLRPPKQLGSTFNVNDIVINSNNGVVNVHSGDVGTNANMNYAGTGAVMNIDSGYGIYYFDPYNPPAWSGPPSPPMQTVQKLNSLIADPGYRYPDMSLATTYTDARTSQVSPTPPAGLAVERADLNSSCMTLAQSVPSAYSFMPSPLTAATNVYCYKPGIYQSGTGSQNAQIVVGSSDIALLYPGVYYLKSGMQVGGRLIGGFVASAPGVALMFDESGPGNCSQCVFTGNSALTISLNAGTKFPGGSSGTAATAAVDSTGVLVNTGTLGPTPPLIISFLVKKDTGGSGGTQGCYVPTSAPFNEPSSCQDSQNAALTIGGGGQLVIEGVTYAPTDNVTLAGGSDNTGTVGQVISWTITYTGSATLKQQGPTTTGPGILHLDAACSGGSSICNP